MSLTSVPRSFWTNNSSEPNITHILTFYLKMSCEFLLCVCFRAFDVHKRKYLSCKDVLLGLAAMEPSTQHGGMPAEMRCRYIFRYYDRNMDGHLQFDEFKLVTCRVYFVFVVLQRLWMVSPKLMYIQNSEGNAWRKEHPWNHGDVTLHIWVQMTSLNF